MHLYLLKKGWKEKIIEVYNTISLLSYMLIENLSLAHRAASYVYNPVEIDLHTNASLFTSKGMERRINRSVEHY